MKKMIMVILIFCLILLQYQLGFSEVSLISALRLQKMIHAEQENNATLLQRNQALEIDIQALKGFPEALEERARSELGMIKKGETFFIVVDPSR